MPEAILAARRLSGNCKKKLDARTKRKSKKLNPNLGFPTVCKMIHKFLTCDRIKMKEERCLKYTKDELARMIGITPKELEKLNAPYFYRSIASRLNLPLIKLYCATKWIDSGYKT